MVSGDPRRYDPAEVEREEDEEFMRHLEAQGRRRTAREDAEREIAERRRQRQEFEDLLDEATG